MVIVRISERGQINIPASVRRKLGIKPESLLSVDVSDDEIIIKPVKSIGDLAGVFREYADGKTQDWETIRAETEAAIAREAEGKARR